MTRAHNWIYYSTIAMIFGAAFNVRLGTFRLESFYLLIVINLWLMLLMKQLWAPKGLIIFLGFLLCSGALGIVRHTDTIGRVAKELTAVSFCAFYSCSFFRTINFKLEESFRLYAKMACWVQVIGLVIYPFQYFFIGHQRYTGIMAEPSYIALIGLPALYYYADRWQRERKHGKEVIIFLAAFCCAQSSTGFSGLLIALCIFCLRYHKLRLVMPIIAISGFLLFYSQFHMYSERVNDTYRTFSSQSVGDTNLSTFVLYTNFYVMEKVLQEHPIMGNGFGSTGESFERYIGTLDTGVYANSEVIYYNAEDASSLTIRVLSDMGLLGAILMLWFIWHFRPRENSEFDVMRTAILIYFFVKLLRGGLYFQTEQYYYTCFYALAPTVLRGRTIAAYWSKPCMQDIELRLSEYVL